MMNENFKKILFFLLLGLIMVGLIESKSWIFVLISSVMIFIGYKIYLFLQRKKYQNSYKNSQQRFKNKQYKNKMQSKKKTKRIQRKDAPQLKVIKGGKAK